MDNDPPVSWTFSEIHVFVHIQLRPTLLYTNTQTHNTPTHKHTNTPTRVSDLTTCFPTHGVLCVCVCVCVCPLLLHGSLCSVS